MGEGRGEGGGGEGGRGLRGCKVRWVGAGSLMESRVDTGNFVQEQIQDFGRGVLADLKRLFFFLFLTQAQIKKNKLR